MAAGQLFADLQKTNLLSRNVPVATVSENIYPSWGGFVKVKAN
jgi:hypothetical protein